MSIFAAVDVICIDFGCDITQLFMLGKSISDYFTPKSINVLALTYTVW